MKLVGLKTVEMADEGRFSSIVINNKNNNYYYPKYKEWQENGNDSEEASERLVLAIRGVDDNQRIRKFKEQNVAAKATEACKELMHKQKQQLMQLVQFLKQIEAQVNSSQDDIFQTLVDNRASIQKLFQHAVTYLYAIHQSCQSNAISINVLKVPSGEVLTFGDDNFIQYEAVGVREARKAAFVLVAGGLGERLGYNGIKVALPSESVTGTCFLQRYIESILALQDASCWLVQGDWQAGIPLVIMTSDDTHSRTVDLLESNAYFGMKPTQVKLLKQEKVACLIDNDAHLALEQNNKYRIQTKPHGHGDVHALLYSSGLLKQWHAAGLRWVLFFQDTNGLLFKAIPASLGVSATKQYHVNSLAVPRKAKEAIGGITRLSHKDGRTMVINVEYNQLDPLLRATGYPDGDVNSETGYSPFPGNINQLILELGPYMEELTRTGGAIKEFVNPKYKDSTKTAFKSSTRLECMMQDYPKTLSPSARVGFTMMDTWLAYAPVKNNPEDAAKVPKGNPYHSATSGEMAIYQANSLILRKAGVKVDDPVCQTFNGQEVEVWPRIVWKPKWALTFAEVKNKVSGNCVVTQISTMDINGRSIFLEDLSLDGALLVNAVDSAEVKVGGRVQNKSWIIENVDHTDTSVPEEVRIRGFKFNKVEQLEKTYSEPGKFSLNP